MLVLTLLLLSANVFASSAARRIQKPYYHLEDANKHFEEFMITYNKVYASEMEKEKRFEIFKQNLEEINKMNADPNQQYAEFGVTKFSDLTLEELENMYTGLNTDFIDDSITFNVSELLPIELSDNFDWRDHNAVTPVKNQKKCGSCWAFSTTGTLEGAYVIKHKTLLSFSEQQMVDCDETNNGCHGGLPYQALSYIRSVGGIQSEEDYPYTAKEGKCVFDSKKVKAKVTGWKTIHLDDDNQVRQSLVQLGPISISLACAKFHGYKSGILDCPADDNVNHAVLLVGYGTDNNGVPYWLVKNSWDKSWGENGYIRLKVTKNPCAMKDHPGVVAEVA